MKFCIYLPAIALSASLLSGCGNSKEKKPPAPKQDNANKQAPIRADAFLVKKVTLTDNIEIPGSLVANEATDIHPEVSGRITYLNISEGRPVSKGTLLAKLYDGDLQARMKSLEVQLKKSEIQLKIAQQSEERSAKLLKIQGISQQDYDLSSLQVNNIMADMGIINAQMGELRANMSKLNIYAPFSGRLGLKMVSSGAYVSPASTLTSITQLDQMKLDFTVPEKYSPQIKIGQPVNFVLEGSNTTYTAKVAATESNITENTRSLQIRAAVQGAPADLIPGKFAKVTLNFVPDTNAITIPSQAIIPQARGKKVYLYENGKAKFIDVTTGMRDSANVEILTGLKAGDTVLVTGLLSLKPDAKVMLGRIVNVSSPGPPPKTGEAKKPGSKAKEN
jgi:membrane fusion protein (multidrug efflux system)